MNIGTITLTLSLSFRIRDPDLILSYDEVVEVADYPHPHRPMNQLL